MNTEQIIFELKQIDALLTPEQQYEALSAIKRSMEMLYELALECKGRCIECNHDFASNYNLAMRELDRRIAALCENEEARQRQHFKEAADQ